MLVVLGVGLRDLDILGSVMLYNTDQHSFWPFVKAGRSFSSFSGGTLKFRSTGWSTIMVIWHSYGLQGESIHASSSSSLCAVAFKLTLSTTGDRRLSNGGSALILTGGKGNEGVVELLLGTGVFDVNAVDLDGSTPIQLAAKAGHEVTVRLLLDVPNIDISIRNPVGGHPATSTAQANGHTKVSSYIDTYSTNVTYASSSLLYTQRATVAPPDLDLTNNALLQEFLNGLVSIL
ncbi:hypothetical protein BKA70DRAFT_1515408 [Coprinopsis sp. MPI-PUGE-AT-0042]|nr:hypothetical protein BKA70DRAFT_1515408 [Coprinopsis sp. MPI-PUGE-AT-0042]